MSSKTTQIVAVAGCKGGIGKTMLSVNLALSLLKKGRRVTLMDGNFSVPGVSNSLGLSGDELPSDVESSPVRLEKGPLGLPVLTVMDESNWMGKSGAEQVVRTINSIDYLAPSLDTLVIDTAPGLSPDNVALIQAAGEIVILINHERPSLLDAVRMVRLLYWAYGISTFNVVVNSTNNRRSGVDRFELLQSFLTDEVGVLLRYLGTVPSDRAVSQALDSQQALIEVSPDCKAAAAIDRIADRIRALPASLPRGRIEFFLPTRIKEGV